MENKEKPASAKGASTELGRSPTEDKKLNIESLQKELEEYQKQKEEYLEGWKRERANFLNYKKEEMERIEGLIKYANEELIMKFLPILDNLDIAEKKIPEDLKQDKNVKGILQIKTQILDFLKAQGVEEIESIGEKFDPNFHEGVGEVENKDKEQGIIIEEIKKGYKINGRLLRPAKVKVAK